MIRTAIRLLGSGVLVVMGVYLYGRAASLGLVINEQLWLGDTGASGFPAPAPWTAGATLYALAVILPSLIASATVAGALHWYRAPRALIAAAAALATILGYYVHYWTPMFEVGRTVDFWLLAAHAATIVTVSAPAMLFGCALPRRIWILAAGSVASVALAVGSYEVSSRTGFTEFDRLVPWYPNHEGHDLPRPYFLADCLLLYYSAIAPAIVSSLIVVAPLAQLRAPSALIMCLSMLAAFWGLWQAQPGLMEYLFLPYASASTSVILTAFLVRVGDHPSRCAIAVRSPDLREALFRVGRLAGYAAALIFTIAVSVTFHWLAVKWGEHTLNQLRQPWDNPLGFRISDVSWHVVGWTTFFRAVLPGLVGAAIIALPLIVSCP